MNSLLRHVDTCNDIINIAEKLVQTKLLKENGTLSEFEVQTTQAEMVRLNDYKGHTTR